MIKQKLPVAIAIAFGLLTLIGLLFLPELSHLILGWAGFLAAVALLLGVLNLLAVHLGRFVSGRNLYSGVLVLSMLAVFGLAITDSLAITQEGLTTVFNWIQAPLEAAVASLLAFFLLFSGFQALKRQRNGWTVLFLLTAVLLLISQALTATDILPVSIRTIIEQFQNSVNDIIVVAGVRGLLIGVALGAVTLSLRLLFGLDQPYNK
ncbi:MAG: hypothetical protein GY803_26820 [Chloroflexi bacterium]|nr:hypothetical protein [Chloroflexota bacterium]